MPGIAQPLKLLCPIKHYDWGRQGADSVIAGLSAQSLSCSAGPLAELWVGAHPSDPASCQLQEKFCAISELIAAYPEEILGRDILAKFGTELPFMLKVLSIGRPLSIQLHPGKELALRFHSEEPQNFPDPRHKPEMAVAISSVSLLCGFRSMTEIQQAVRTVPEFAQLVNEQTITDLSCGNPSALPVFYEQLMTAQPVLVAECCRSLYRRLKHKTKPSAEDLWVLKLAEEYPDGETGLFSFYLLNLIRLSPGESVFLKPGLLHAYLEGELIECMSNSDNVIRGGLTKKRIDPRRLLQSVDYTAQARRMAPQATSAEKSSLDKYFSEAEEFVLELCRGKAEQEFATEGKVNLLFCLEGQGQLNTAEGAVALREGEALLIPAILAKYNLRLEWGKVFRVSVP